MNRGTMDSNTARQFFGHNQIVSVLPCCPRGSSIIMVSKHACWGGNCTLKACALLARPVVCYRVRACTKPDCAAHSNAQICVTCCCVATLFESQISSCMHTWT